MFMVYPKLCTRKGPLRTAGSVLAERGLVGYDLRLADVWPEFAAHDKDQVTLRHVLCHTAGVPGLPPDLTVADLCDWDHMCAVLSAARPWWEPGTRFGYHNLTFGFLVGETLRCATGRSISDLLREYVTGPLGISEEVYFGVPADLLPRVARQDAAGTPMARPEPGSPRSPIAASTMSPESPRGGHLAYSPHRPGAAPAEGSAFGMPGANGSAAYGDINSGVSVAIMRNRFSGDFTAAARIGELVTAVLS